MSEMSRVLVKPVVMLAAVIVCYLPIDLLAGGYTIDHYEFGKIIVSGKTYESDIVIMPDGSVRPGPDDMHYVLLDEIDDIINMPEIKTLVIGTGAEGNGMLRKKLVKEVNAKGITLKMMLTEDAMEMLNGTSKEGLVAVLHLNC